MEFGTPTVSSFDRQTTPPFSNSKKERIDSVEVHSDECLSSGTSFPSNHDIIRPISEHKSRAVETLIGSTSESKPTMVQYEENVNGEHTVSSYGNGQSPVVTGVASTSSKSSAAVKVQKVYRSYRTRRRLADSAVVAEELWWQAIDFARLNLSTISFFNFSKPETAASRWCRVVLNASKIDPRHRYGHSLQYYYDEWCKADSGQPFFYWLDIGDGKELDLKECPRSKLREQCIKYLGPQEREHYEYGLVEGKIVHKQTKQLLDTSKGMPGAKWIFVMSTSKKFYAGEKKKGIFHHSSFLAGGATLAAGRLSAENGILKSISAYSGHYRPTDDRLDSFLSFLQENGVYLNEVQIRRASEDYESSEDIRVTDKGTKAEIPTQSEHQSEIETGEEGSSLPESAQNLSENYYRRSLSGGLQSARAEVPKTKILHRINSKVAARSYQLGHQLSLKWTTGAGPRIGCVADYPEELRVQALEFVNLSPRVPLTPAASV